MSQEKPKGPVIIIGGGIAGIEAALSLAGAGYGVHLVERTASLGGMIPNLHRTYPLCACCKLDPRIAACKEHPNINVMSNSTLLDVSGEIGDFTVSMQTDNGKEILNAGAIILAAGVEPSGPSGCYAYSYGLLPNVITSVEYEQIQRPLGPQQGILERPSDGRAAKKIAWLQCVGSRNINQCDAPYCSSVCCMYALKEAVNSKAFDEDIETTIFYMDMRTHGKGFEDYLNRAISRGVTLKRSRIHTVDPVPGGDDLAIRYVDETGQIQGGIFDLVVLSVGLRASREAIELAQKMGVDLCKNQFISTQPFKPVSTNIAGVFVCGGLGGPADINESIVQATAAVSEIASILEPESFFAPRTYPKRSDARWKEPRAIVAYHLCPDMDPDIGTELEKCAKEIPGVASALSVNGDMLTALVDNLRQSGANRLVFCSCTPVIHRNLIEEALKLAGLNPCLYETVDLRVIDSQTASIQLRDQLRLGVARAALISAPSLAEVPVVKRALVVGGGVSGLESALALAKEGYLVTLVEKEKEIGGHCRHVRSTWQGHDAQEYLKTLISSAETNEKITVMTETRVKENKGFAGSFFTTLSQGGKDIRIEHGVTILAPGGDPIKPKEYLYGQHKNVYLWSELSARLVEDPSSIESADAAVFIQCVGSREPERPHCSNLCCSFTVRTVLDLKTANPDMSIYVLYREMRTFGKREELYLEARKKGVIFFRYDLENKPRVDTEDQDGQDKLRVTVFDPILRRPVCFKADFISLQTAIVGTSNKELADIFRINLDSNGFFAESPEKLRPLDASGHGIYLAGLAHYPKDTTQSITQAKAAAARAMEFLKQDTVLVGGMVAEVDPEKCAVCGTCVRTCPFNVPFIDRAKEAAYIDPGLCQGCGICAAECPAKAIAIPICSDQMLTEAASILLATS